MIFFSRTVQPVLTESMNTTANVHQRLLGNIASLHPWCLYYTLKLHHVNSMTVKMEFASSLKAPLTIYVNVHQGTLVSELNFSSCFNMMVKYSF